MSTLDKAIALAAAAHVGQVDKAGAPYILHPLRVMLAVEGEHAKMAAVLHDVVEDTYVTIAELSRAGFPKPVIAAVIALTKLPGMSRLEAARMAAADPIARVVKLADLADNMRLERIASPSPRDIERAAEYRALHEYLSHHIGY